MRRWLIAVLLLLAGSPSAAADGRTPDFFSPEPAPTWGTGPSGERTEAGRYKAGRVVAIAEADGKVFLAGEFTGVTPPGTGTGAARRDPSRVVRRPYLVALDVQQGTLMDWDAQPDGPVLALAVSADGTRLYAGGAFKTIGGGEAPRLAALDVVTGRLDASFEPPAPDAYVRAMALSHDTLYIGGAFTEVGTTERPQLAALDAVNGALRSDWIPPHNDGGHFADHTGTRVDDGDPGNVADVKVTADGTMVVIAGSFLRFGGRSGLLVLDARTARPTRWQPELDRPRPVRGLAIWPGDGRSFFVAAGGAGGAVEAFTPGASSTPRWIRTVDGDGTDVAATRRRVYLVGHYDYVLGQKTTCGMKSCTGGNDGDVFRRHVAAFDTGTGALDEHFAPQLDTPQGPEVAVIGAGHLSVGGDFTRVNFAAHPGFAQFPATDGPGSTGTSSDSTTHEGGAHVVAATDPSAPVMPVRPDDRRVGVPRFEYCGHLGRCPGGERRARRSAGNNPDRGRRDDQLPAGRILRRRGPGH